jgi:hypothetical protein
MCLLVYLIAAEVVHLLQGVRGVLLCSAKAATIGWFPPAFGERMLKRRNRDVAVLATA